MPSANSVAGLMKWVEREQWCEAFADLLDRHLGRACRSANIEPEDLASLIDDQDFGTLWGCAFEDFLSRDLDDGRNVVDDYLKRRGWKESASNRAYMSGLRSSVMSLYEVSDIVPNESFLARDLVRGGEPVRVSERSATKSLRQWDRIAARLIDLRGKTVMSGGVLAFDHHLGEEVLAALSRAGKTARKESIKFMKSVGHKPDKAELDQLVGDDAVLRASAFLFTTIWLRNYLDHVMHPVSKQISNSDGEPLEFQSLHYPLLPSATPEAVRSALASIPEVYPESKAFWNWIGGETTTHGAAPRAPEGQTFVTTMDDGRIVLGSLELKGKTLILSVNSRGRAERGRALLDNVLTDLVREPLVETQTVEQMMAARGDAPPKASSDLSPEDERAVIHETLDDHYGRMLDEPIPALGNVTPLKAAKMAKGREKVIAWLKTIENHSAEMPKGDPMATYDFTWLWEELGLADQRL